jgi:hypothetical protein
VHELAHALADQNFPIQKFLSENSEDSEQSLARETVVEGQASWLMIEYGARRSGRTLKDPETASDLLRDQPDNATDDSAYPVFSKAPLYIRRTLMFPYEEGEKFQQAVFLKEGKGAFARLFDQPPVSTAQVIHPDRYFAKIASTTPELPKPIRHAKAFVGGSVGELDQRILLQQYIDTYSADRRDETGPPPDAGLCFRMAGRENCRPVLRRLSAHPARQMEATRSQRAE